MSSMRLGMLGYFFGLVPETGIPVAELVVVRDVVVV